MLLVWYDDAVFLLTYLLQDFMRLIYRYPVLFTCLFLSFTLGLILLILRWFYRAT